GRELRLAGWRGEAPAAALQRTVKTLLIEVAPVSDVGSVTGEIKARTESDLGFRIGGRLRERLVDVGALVAREEVLARLDDTNEVNSVGIAEAQLAAAGAEVHGAEGNEARHGELLRHG